jgi:tungstate transport system ATP-binding protein
MILYELSGVQKHFDKRKVLDIDHLTLPGNTACALLGPNGSGKTTLLHILALLTPPTTGVFRFMGEPVDWQKNRILPLRRKVVLVDQHPIMFSTTVLKNVAYGLKMRGETRARQKQIAMECLDRVGLHDYANRSAHRLSGGETQRVAIARALACGPEVLLLDEPTAGVDVENQIVVEKIILDLRNEKNISIVFSTHNPLQAERLALKKVFLNAGRLAAPAAVNRFSMAAIKQNRLMASAVEKMIDAKAVLNYPADKSLISIDPEKIRIYRSAADETTRNRSFPGKVLQMSAEADRIRVVLDARGEAGEGCGIHLTAFVCADDLRQTLVVPGDLVQIALEADAATIYDPEWTAS